jgi:hypothetical protein
VLKRFLRGGVAAIPRGPTGTERRLHRGDAAACGTL